MEPYEFTQQASSDLLAIWSYIAPDNQVAADAVADAVLDCCLLLSRFPEMGFRRPFLTQRDVRFFVVSQFPNYVIAYLPDTVPLRVVRVLWGFQNMRRLVIDSEK